MEQNGSVELYTQFVGCYFHKISIDHTVSSFFQLVYDLQENGR